MMKIFRSVLQATLFWVAVIVTGLISLLPKRRPGGGKRAVLIIATDVLGDNVCRVPFYRVLREHYPKEDWHIIFLAKPVTIGLLKTDDLFDEVIALKEEFYRNLFRQLVKGVLFWGARNKVEVVFNFVRFRHVGFDYFVKLTRPAHAYAFRGYGYRLWAYDFWYVKFLGGMLDKVYTDEIEDPNCTRTELWEGLSRMMLAAEIRIPAKAEGVASVLRIEKPKLPLPNNYVVFVPGAGSEIRRWPAERFADVAKLLLNIDDGLRFFVTGVGAETNLGEIIRKSLPEEKCFNLCGHLSVAELFYVVSKADFVVTNETGTAQIGAAFERQTFCILGGGDFGVFCPRKTARTLHAIYRQRECFGCRWQCGETFIDGCVPCVMDVQVEDVVRCIRQTMRFEGMK